MQQARMSQWELALQQFPRRVASMLKRSPLPKRASATAWRRRQGVRSVGVDANDDFLAATMRTCMSQGRPEEAFRVFDDATTSFGILPTAASESLALASLQQQDAPNSNNDNVVSSSEFMLSQRMLRLIAADKGVDINTGEYISSLYTSEPQDQRQTHPAWRVPIRPQTAEESHRYLLDRRWMTISAAYECWPYDKAVGLCVSFALHELQRICCDVSLRNHVAPWTIAAVAQPLLAYSGANLTPYLGQRPPKRRQRSPASENMLPIDFSRTVRPLADSLAAVCPAVPTLDIRLCSYLFSSSPRFDEVFLDRCADFLFSTCATSSDAWSARPGKLSTGNLSGVYPRLRADERLQHIVQRTLRPDVSQGVIIPDASYIVNSFDRLVAMSQHHEIVVPFHVLSELITRAAPSSKDWARYVIRLRLRQLLHSVTWDGNTPHVAEPTLSHPQCDSGDDEEYGGVTLLGLFDECHILESTRGDLVSGSGASSVALSTFAFAQHLPLELGMKVSCELLGKDCIGLVAKHFLRMRRQLVEGHVTDAIGELLSGIDLFGSSRKSLGGRGGKGKKESGKVVVATACPDTKCACYLIGVETVT